MTKQMNATSFKAALRAVNGSAFSMGGIATLCMASVLLAPQAQPVKEAFSVTLPRSTSKISMVAVPGGTVTVGGKAVEVKPFTMSTTEVTWDAFDVYVASGPASKPYDTTDFKPDAIARPSRSYAVPDLGWGHKGFPAINVHFTSADMFCRWLASTTKKKFRLPTEAEWELACRGGVSGAWTMDEAAVSLQAWHKGNSKEVTHAVGRKAANPYGLFDILGNVGEWVVAADGRQVLAGGTFVDGPELQNPTRRQEWAPFWQETDPQEPKSRWWLADAPFVGFRVVCEQ
jgi:formylglycine-generating enzyme required for sulfatase activity